MSAKGQTLLEVLIASFLGSAILGGVLLLMSPYLGQFQGLLSFNQLRVQLFSPMDTIQRDVAGAREVFTDATQCYALCLVDNSTGQRVSYYWVNNDLYRKSESTNNPIACSNGTIVARALDKANSSFAAVSGLVNVKLGGNDTKTKTNYRLNTAAFPSYTESANTLRLGLDCGVSGAWSFQTSTDTYWSIANGGEGFILRADRSQGGNNTEDATAEIPIDLSGFTSPYLSFEYRNEGNIKDGDSLRLEFWDGSTWIALFSDTTSDNINFRSVTIDLSGQTLGANNKLRILGSLTKNPATWSVRNLEIASR